MINVVVPRSTEGLITDRGWESNCFFADKTIAGIWLLLALKNIADQKR